MNTVPLTNAKLKNLGFVSMKFEEPPRIGALLLCYHKVYGLTVGYWAGEQACFIFPFVSGYNWATHWQYHN